MLTENEQNSMINSVDVMTAAVVDERVSDLVTPRGCGLTLWFVLTHLMTEKRSNKYPSYRASPITISAEIKDIP